MSKYQSRSYGEASSALHLDGVPANHPLANVGKLISPRGYLHALALNLGEVFTYPTCVGSLTELLGQRLQVCVVLVGDLWNPVDPDGMAATTSKFAPLPGYSRGDINRAGRTLRTWWLSDDDDEAGVPDEVVRAYMAMMSFREFFQTPLTKTVMGLRSMVKSECPELKASGDPGEALKAYEELEEQHRDDRHMEIVLVGADSIETVMLTHGNYWAVDPDAEPAASPYLAGV